MRVLIVGSGGREHALAWKLKRGGRVDALYCAPGNGGTAAEGQNVPLSEGDLPGLVQFAQSERIDLVIPGPELPLTLGIVDAMREVGIPCFGPDKWCAQLEGSKHFAKSVMERAGVPTARSRVFQDADAAEAYIREHGAPVVVKADGLAAGKGVVVAQTLDEALAAVHRIMRQRDFGDAGDNVIVEDFLQGEEVSLLAFCSGETALPLPSAQDHKAAFDGDTGPNTGGMGAYSPAPILPDSELERMTDLTIRPILREMSRQGHPFTGILYAGLMITADGPKVLEYNTRFGDPECQPLLMRLDSDLLELMLACTSGSLPAARLAIRPQAALGVVVAADGYPGAYAKGLLIEGVEAADAMPGAKVFQAGTRLEEGRLLSTGGRVLCVAALGDSLADAQKHAYEAVKRLSMPGGRYRSDIGAKGLTRLARG